MLVSGFMNVGRSVGGGAQAYPLDNTSARIEVNFQCGEDIIQW